MEAQRDDHVFHPLWDSYRLTTRLSTPICYIGNWHIRNWSYLRFWNLAHTYSLSVTCGCYHHLAQFQGQNKWLSNVQALYLLMFNSFYFCSIPSTYSYGHIMGLIITWFFTLSSISLATTSYPTRPPISLVNRLRSMICHFANSLIDALKCIALL